MSKTEQQLQLVATDSPPPVELPQVPVPLVQLTTDEPVAEDYNQAPQNVIIEQQKKIEELQMALQMSQMQLLQQQKLMLSQQSQLDTTNNQKELQMDSIVDNDLLHQNSQLQEQVAQLEAMQLRVQEHQEAVMRSLSTSGPLQMGSSEVERRAKALSDVIAPATTVQQNHLPLLSDLQRSRNPQPQQQQQQQQLQEQQEFQVEDVLEMLIKHEGNILMWVG